MIRNSLITTTGREDTIRFNRRGDFGNTEIKVGFRNRLTLINANFNLETTITVKGGFLQFEGCTLGDYNHVAVVNGNHGAELKLKDCAIFGLDLREFRGSVYIEKCTFYHNQGTKIIGDVKWVGRSVYYDHDVPSLNLKQMFKDLSSDQMMFSHLAHQHEEGELPPQVTGKEVQGIWNSMGEWGNYVDLPMTLNIAEGISDKNGQFIETFDPTRVKKVSGKFVMLKGLENKESILYYDSSPGYKALAKLLPQASCAENWTFDHAYNTGNGCELYFVTDDNKYVARRTYDGWLFLTPIPTTTSEL